MEPLVSTSGISKQRGKFCTPRVNIITDSRWNHQACCTFCEPLSHKKSPHTRTAHRVLHAVSTPPSCGRDISPEAALRSLLKGRSIYDMDQSGATLAPYQASLLDLRSIELNQSRTQDRNIKELNSLLRDVVSDMVSLEELEFKYW